MKRVTKGENMNKLIKHSWGEKGKKKKNLPASNKPINPCIDLNSWPVESSEETSSQIYSTSDLLRPLTCYITSSCQKTDSWH